MTASAVDVFAISAAAKLGATIVTYPLQLIKARLQSAGKHTHADRQYTGTLNAILRIWQTEGAPGTSRWNHHPYRSGSPVHYPADSSE